MRYSSETIIDILKDFGYDILPYIHTLNWKEDYSINNKYISQGALNEILEIIDSGNGYTMTQTQIIIELGPEERKRSENWINTLPPELKANVKGQRDLTRFTLDKITLERYLGKKLKKKGENYSCSKRGDCAMKIFIYARATENMQEFETILDLIPHVRNEIYAATESIRAFRLLDEIRNFCQKDDIQLIHTQRSLGTNDEDILNRLQWFIEKPILYSIT